jgi:hypothetical protein
VNTGFKANRLKGVADLLDRVILVRMKDNVADELSTGTKVV